MIILGIDPGTTSIGYAFIETVKSPRLIRAGLIKIKTPQLEDKIVELHTALQKLIKKWRPQAVAIEQLFFAKNQKTALAVAQARGAALLTTTLAGLKFYEYTPLEVKKIVTGDGRADKLQVHKLIKLTLPETADLKYQDDMFDAIAVALTCYFKERSSISS